jgi:hypothetical protein
MSARTSDAQPEARWKDQYSAARASIAIYDVIEAENARARWASMCDTSS